MKSLIVDHIGLDKDALHIYVALFVFLLACKLFRWPASSWKPWCVVLVVAVTGEYLDWQHNLARELPVIVNYHWTDLWNTMLVPTILLIAARFSDIFEKPDRDPQSD